MSDTPRTDAVARPMPDPHWPNSRMGGCDMVSADFARQLEREVNHLRAALHDIHVTAHCLAKAGPLNTPDLETAWVRFMRLSVMATAALSRYD